MTLQELIKRLTWYDLVNKLKEILTLLQGSLLPAAPIDGNQYGMQDGDWTEITGGIESVTGDIVDNTDPLNPIINAPIVPAPSLQQVVNTGNVVTNNSINVNNGAMDSSSLNHTGLTLSQGSSANTGLVKTSVLTDNRVYSLPDQSGTIALLSDIVTDVPTIEEVLTEGSHVAAFEDLTFGDDVAYNTSLESVRVNRLGINIQGGVDLTNLGAVAIHSPEGTIDPYVEYTKLVASVFQSLKIKVTNVTASNVILQYTGVSGNIPSLNTSAPASASDTGNVGEIRVTPTFVYMCIAPNTWVRAAMATW